MVNLKTFLSDSSPPPVPKPLYRLPMTAVLSTVLLAIFVTSQLIGSALFAPLVLPDGQQLNLDERVLMGSENGTVVSLAVFLTLIAVVVTIWLFIRARKGAIADYLALKPFRWGQLVGLGVVLLLLNVAINGVSIWLEREPMVFMDELAASAHPFWLLVVAMVIIAPIYEELMFRGFIWSGLAGSSLGVWGASIVTSIIFALIHMQYGMVEMVGIIVLAMLFSYARMISGSLFLPMVLHVMNNGLAMWQYLGG